MTPADSSGAQAAGGAEVAAVREALEQIPVTYFRDAEVFHKPDVLAALDRLAARIEQQQAEVERLREALKSLVYSELVIDGVLKERARAALAAEGADREAL